MKLIHKTAIVTGAGNGIGQATALSFARQGAQVVVSDIDFAAAQLTADKIKDTGGEAIAVRADVSSLDDIQSLIDNTVGHFGKLDILVNNAGVILPKKLDDVSEAEWNRLCDINLKGVVFGCKLALPELRKSKGNIVNMASMTGVSGQQNNSVYSATKGGVIALTRSLAIDCAMESVRVNAVCPAGVSTPLLESWLASSENPEEARNNQDYSHLLGRTATSQEIASVVTFLVSNEASFITGQDIHVEGGATLGYGVGPKAEWSSVLQPRQDTQNQE